MTASRYGSACACWSPCGHGLTSGPPRRSTVTIRSDNMSALALASKLNSAAGSSCIGRELALLCTEACWEPSVVENLPGVANGLSDSLSRLAEPGKSYTVPSALAHLQATPMPARDRAYDRALALMN